jgi:UDP-glucose 4-epimerase
MPKIVVTGGCGYIGSHTVIDLINNGYDVISIDNFIRSKTIVLDLIKKVTGKIITNHSIDLCDLTELRKVFNLIGPVDGIIHFAALKSVPESVAQPLLYYNNNLSSVVNILKILEEFNIPSLIFSSSCSVYGNTKELPVSESTALGTAESPYAATKQIGERIIEDFIKTKSDKNAILLRYFNPGGAHPSGLIGEIPQQSPTNLIPILMESIQGIRDNFTVHGNDYNTRDGSCIRDYIHIMDLANAHTKCVKYLIEYQNDQKLDVFNVGIGQGVSVFEAINAVEKASGKKVPYILGPRREGDIEAIYANYDKAAKKLNWNPKYNIEDIMSSAWAWEQERKKLSF